MEHPPRPPLGPHVVLLGAGASRAAFPNGDKAGRSLPLMDDLVAILDLRSVCEEVEPIEDTNFESVYSKLAEEPRYEKIRGEVERRVADYFSSLELPDEATLYDKLLLSLRRRDAVFTFNWDPFLFDAYMRNANVLDLPKIFFLHGSVRIGVCPTHIERRGLRRKPCPDCGVPFNDVPLLYPVNEKEYTSDPYIADNWAKAQWFFKEAFVLTIFGYSGPGADRGAVDLLRNAWMARSARRFEHVEVVDIAPEEDLQERWGKFTPTNHLQVVRDYEKSFVGRWPRRSREQLFLAMSKGIPSYNGPLTDTNDLMELQAQVRGIAGSEMKISGRVE